MSYQMKTDEELTAELGLPPPLGSTPRHREIMENARLAYESFFTTVWDPVQQKDVRVRKSDLPGPEDERYRRPSREGHSGGSSRARTDVD